MFIRLGSGSLTETFVLTVVANHPFAGRPRRQAKPRPPQTFSRASVGKYLQIRLFVSVQQASMVLGWKMPPLYRWSARLHLRTADSTPDIKGRPWESQRNPLDPDLPLSMWRSILLSSSSRPSAFSGPAPRSAPPYFWKGIRLILLLLASYNSMQMISA